jgi:hypothetical protein
MFNHFIVYVSTVQLDFFRDDEWDLIRFFEVTRTWQNNLSNSTKTIYQTWRKRFIKFDTNDFSSNLIKRLFIKFDKRHFIKCYELYFIKFDKRHFIKFDKRHFIKFDEWHFIKLWKRKIISLFFNKRLHASTHDMKNLIWQKIILCED